MNTCSLPFCSILAWSVFLERIGKPSLGGEGSVQCWLYCMDRDSQLSPLAGAGESYFYLGVNVGT